MLFSSNDMGTNEIKQLLYEGIENIDDQEFLLTIKELIDHRYSVSEVPTLAGWQESRIRESERQIENGEFLADDQVDKIVDRWLKE